jgi:hypothetical protein
MMQRLAMSIASAGKSPQRERSMKSSTAPVARTWSVIGSQMPRKSGRPAGMPGHGIDASRMMSAMP